MQTTLANKDLEYKDQEQAISKKLNEKMNQLALYQSILKSKGFDLSTLNEESPHSRYNSTETLLLAFGSYFIDYTTWLKTYILQDVLVRLKPTCQIVHSMWVVSLNSYTQAYLLSLEILLLFIEFRLKPHVVREKDQSKHSWISPYARQECQYRLERK